MLAFAVSVLATAETGSGGGAGGLGTLPILIVMGVIFYFLLIRPQQKRSRAQRSLLSSLGPGDRVVTIGGIHGTIVELDDDTVILEIAPGMTVTFARQAIGRRLVDADAGDEDDDSDEGAALPSDVSGPHDQGAATGGTIPDDSLRHDQP